MKLKRIICIGLLIISIMTVGTSCGKETKKKELFFQEASNQNCVYKITDSLDVGFVDEFVIIDNSLYMLQSSKDLCRVELDSGETTNVLSARDDCSILVLGEDEDSSGILLLEKQNEIGTVFVFDGNETKELLKVNLMDKCVRAIHKYNDGVCMLYSDGTMHYYNLFDNTHKEICNQIEVLHFSNYNGLLLCLGVDNDKKYYTIYEADPNTGICKVFAETEISFGSDNSYAYVDNLDNGDLVICNSAAFYVCDVEQQVFYETLWHKIDLLYPKNVEVDKNGDMFILKDGIIKVVSKSNHDRTEEKIDLKLATLTMPEENGVLYRVVQEYNAKSQNCHIEIVNYSSDLSNKDAALQKLATEIISGASPDILDCTDFSNQQIIKMVKNGVLMNLNEMVDINNYHPGILATCEVDGDLYSVVGAYSVQSLFGPEVEAITSSVGTLEEVINDRDLLDQFPLGVSAEELLHLWCSLSLSDLVSYDRKEINKDKLVKMLEQCVMATRKTNEVEQSLFVRSTIRSIHKYVSFQDFYSEVFGTTCKPLCVSYEGHWSYTPKLQFAVCSNSDAPNAGADFVEYVLSAACQSMIKDYLPVNMMVLSEQISQEIEKRDKKYYEFNESEGAKLMSVVEKVQSRTSESDEIISIILDEASAYFQGAKSVNAVAELIEDRVNLFLMEQN